MPDKPRSTYCYKAFGWRIRSEIEIPELRELPVLTEAETDVHIRYGKVPEFLENAVRPGRDGYLRPGEFLLNVFSDLKIWAKNGRKIIIEHNERFDNDTLRVFLLASIFGAIAHQRHNLPLHASAVVANGQAILFCGSSGSGKSTTAAAFHERGYQVYAEDIANITFSEQGVPLLHFGPKRIKIDQQSATLIGRDVADFDPVKKNDDKFAYPIEPPKVDEPVPVKALYQIDTTGHDSIRFKKLSQQETLLSVLQNTFRQRFRKGLGVDVEHFTLSEQLSQQLSAFRVSRPHMNAERMVDYIDRLEEHLHHVTGKQGKTSITTHIRTIRVPSLPNIALNLLPFSDQFMKFSKDSILKRSEDVITSEADNEIVMMNIETGQYHSLNEVGSAIWKIIEVPTSISAICEQLLADYEVEEETCEQEVMDFAALLAAEKLLSE